jgi:hypothetical protein
MAKHYISFSNGTGVFMRFSFPKDKVAGGDVLKPGDIVSTHVALVVGNQPIFDWTVTKVTKNRIHVVPKSGYVYYMKVEDI